MRVSFDIPDYTSGVVAMGSVRLREAIRRIDLRPRPYQACSKEMFGSIPPKQSESSPFHAQFPGGPNAIFLLAFNLGAHDGPERYNGFEGRLERERTKPNGQRRWRLDAKRAECALGFRARASLDAGRRAA
jgi:hypothetical protein